MKCHYCQMFSNIPKSLRKLVGESSRPKTSHRYCRLVHKEVTSNTEACSELVPNRYFWCKKWNGWVDIVVCLVRRKKRVFPCAYCYQYLEIEDICVGRDMFALFGVRRRIIKPVQQPSTNGKPVLKRRKVD